MLTTTMQLNQEQVAKLLESFDASQLPVKFGGTLTDEQMQAGVKAWVAERISAEKS